MTQERRSTILNNSPYVDQNEMNTIDAEFGLAMSKISDGKKTLGLRLLKEIASKIMGFDDFKNYGRVCNNMALVEVDLRLFSDAEAHFQLAAEAFSRINDKLNVARTLGNLGSVYRDIEDFPRAVLNYRKSLEISCECGYLEGQASGKANIGYVLAMKGQYTHAINKFIDAKSDYARSGDVNKVREIESNIRQLERFRTDTKYEGTGA